MSTHFSNDVHNAAITPAALRDDLSASHLPAELPAIAILEDDATQAAWLQHTLQAADMTSQVFSDGSAFLAALRGPHGFRVLLLDWELPGLNGLEVLRWIRANVSEPIAIIFVTNRIQENDLICGLDAGADDYICKPCRAPELLARIRSQLRRQGAINTPETSFALGFFSVNMQARTIRRKDQIVALTPKEFDLAALFLRNPWRLFSREDLSMLVWNREVPSTSRTLDTHLSNIRKKLQLGPSSKVLLSASYALGYRLEILDDAPTGPRTP